ncbi:MAG: flippase, partial [Methanobacteriaceae archaeon]|nr:flippase [Methanobacteriaceae archaeon]
MKTAKTLVKNTGILFSSQILAYLIGLIYLINVAKYLGAENYGVLALALALTGIFSVFVDLGLASLTVREVSKNKYLANLFLGNSLVIKSFFSLITLILVHGIVNILNYPKETAEVIYWITLFVIFNSLSQSVYAIFQSYQKMEYQSLGIILNSILMFIGVTALIFFQKDLMIFAMLYAMISLIIFIISLIICISKFTKPKISINVNVWKNLLRNSLPLGLISIFVVLFIRIDTIMLSKMVSEMAVGWYNASVTLVQSLSFITSAVVVSVFPLFSKLHVNSQKNNFELLFRKTFHYIALISIPIGVGTTILADKIIILLYGFEYSNSIIVLQIIIWWYVIGSFSWIIGTVLNATNKQRIFLIFSGLALISNISLNFILIPKFSYIGASIATILTEVLLFCLLFFRFPHDIYVPNLIKIVIKPILASIIMG